jgi:hypothetical protein
MTVTINGTTGIDSPGGDVSVSQSLSGNLTFTSTGNRITGDFSNATVANRVLFQSSTTNGITSVTAIPNGTATDARFAVNNNSDPTNSNGIQILANATEARIQATNFGTASAFPMTFYTGGSERVRIDTSGNVGIGNSSIAGKLSVDGSVYAGPGSVSGVAYGFYPPSTYGNTGMFSPAANTVAFATSGGERMRLDSNGNFLVGTTSIIQDSKVSINYAIASNRGLALQVDSTSGSDAVTFRNPNGNIGTIQISGSTTAYNTSSDYRLKENVAPMQNALATVAALKPVTYNWKADGSAGQGFIAHELQEVVPDCVTGKKDAVDKDGNPQYQGVDTSFLVATLVAAIQELKAEVDSLKAQLQGTT